MTFSKTTLCLPFQEECVSTWRGRLFKPNGICYALGNNSDRVLFEKHQLELWVFLVKLY